MARLRAFGNYGLILCQFTILFVNREVGAVCAAVCEACILPYVIRMRYWDVVAVTLAFFVIDLSAVHSG